MNIIFSLFLLLIAELLVDANKTEKELNLNFQQNDYQIKFERVELVRYNKDYVQEVSIVTFKYNRSTAVVNATFIVKANVGNEIEGIVQAYKFMSNEYRVFPLRFSANACKALAANVAGTSKLMTCGNFSGCPMLKGRKYHICNWQPDQSKLPPHIPNGQYKVEVQLLHSSIEVGVASIYATVFRAIV